MPHGAAEQGTEEEENEVHLGTARRCLRSVKCLRLKTQRVRKQGIHDNMLLMTLPWV